MFLPLLLLTIGCTSVRAQSAPVESASAEEVNLDSLVAHYKVTRALELRLFQENTTPANQRSVILEDIRKADALYLLRAYDYLDQNGFPRVEKLAEKQLDSLIREVQLKLKEIPETDTLRRQEILAAHYRSVAPAIGSINRTQYFLTILDSEEAFEKRCSLIPFLRAEYEAKSLDAFQLSVYLERTYEILHDGERLDVPPGISGFDRLQIYANELSGCW